MRSIIGVLLVLGLITTHGAAQSSWDRYVPGKLRAIIERHDAVVREVPDSIKEGRSFSYEQFPSLVHARYTGESRPISPGRRFFLAQYFRSVLRLPADSNPFVEEFQFVEDSIAYWLPVQARVVPFLRKEAQPGRNIDLFVVWAGALSRPDSKPRNRLVDWIFLVNDFRTPS